MAPPHPIRTPCVKVCFIDDASGLCLGCFRTLAEGAAWARLDEATRDTVMAELPDRILSLGPKAAAPMLAVARIKSALGA